MTARCQLVDAPGPPGNLNPRFEVESRGRLRRSGLKAVVAPRQEQEARTTAKPAAAPASTIEVA